MSDALSMIPTYVPLRNRSRWLAGLLVAIAVSGWFAAGFDIAEMRLFARESAGVEISSVEYKTHALIRQSLTAVQSLLTGAAAACFLTWIHFARRNLRALGARKMKFSTRNAVVACLIPGVNLWRPYQVVTEIWRASDPEIRDPFAWKEAHVPALFPLWWAALVGFAIVALAGSGMDATSAQNSERIRFALRVEFLADAVAAVAASLFFFVVIRIDAAQDAKHRSHSRPAAREDAASISVAT